jgi:hypothetical protein
MSFKGVWRRREIKFLHTGSKMNATSTWSMRAAVLAIAGEDGRKCSWRKSSAKYISFSNIKPRTEPVSVHSPRVVHIVIQLIVDESQGEDEEVEEDPDEEKQTTATLINHPDIPPVEESLGLVRPPHSRTGGVGSLKRLQPPPLGLVSLKVTGLGSSVDEILLEVRVLVQI